MMSTYKHYDLGNNSSLLYFEKFLDGKHAAEYLQSLDSNLPWTRPTLTIFGRKCEQPRETCYVADKGLPMYKYSGYQPVVHKWDDYPVLKSIVDAVHLALPSDKFNSVLINRYKSGNDYAAWHADDEKLYGPTPTIASVTLGTEREFLIRRKGNKSPQINSNTHKPAVADKQNINNAFDVLITNSAQQTCKPKRKSCDVLTVGKPSGELYSFMLKHGSLFVMKGYTQRDWEHCVPKRKRASGLRINLTFRYINHER
ncbi:hypothetical protein KP509_15G056600 [Ceratopteris richardii]|nr:hypothetical protein KP509_15G056600 [Ceratopteris richardii]